MAYVACQIPIVFNIPAQTFITCVWNTVNTAGRMQILKITTPIVAGASGSYRTTALTNGIQWERFYSLLKQIKKKNTNREKTYRTGWHNRSKSNLVCERNWPSSNWRILPIPQSKNWAALQELKTELITKWSWFLNEAMHFAKRETVDLSVDNKIGFIGSKANQLCSMR